MELFFFFEFFRNKIKKFCLKKIGKIKPIRFFFSVFMLQEKSTIERVKLQDSSSKYVYLPNIHYFHQDETPSRELLQNSQFQISISKEKEIKVEKIEKGEITKNQDFSYTQKNGDMTIESKFL
jgi:hypothetical protein